MDKYQKKKGREKGKLSESEALTFIYIYVGKVVF